MVEKTITQGKDRKQVYRCANKECGFTMDKPEKAGGKEESDA